MNKKELKAQLEAIRDDRLPKITDATKAQLEDLIHVAPVPIDAPPAAPAISTASLLLRYNTSRAKHGRSTLKKWGGTRAELNDAIAREEAETKHAPVTKAPAKIARGANTRKDHTDLHKNPVRDAVAKMDKREDRERVKLRKAHAKTIAANERLRYKLVVEWMEARNTVSHKQPLSREVRADFEKFVADRLQRGKAARKKSEPSKTKRAVGKRTASDNVSPADIASDLKREPRAIRVTLRRIEKDIPATWRVQGERWGFKKAHRADIVKLVGGK